VTTARRLHHRYPEYLAALEISGVKLEYCDGEIYALAGGTPAHADLAAAAVRSLGNALGDRCRVSTSDLKVRDVVRLEQPELTLPVDELYVGIELEGAADRHMGRAQ
jgi:Putative restriction endonuclease